MPPKDTSDLFAVEAPGKERERERRERGARESCFRTQRSCFFSLTLSPPHTQPPSRPRPPTRLTRRTHAAWSSGASRSTWARTRGGMRRTRRPCRGEIGTRKKEMRGEKRVKGGEMGWGGPDSHLSGDARMQYRGWWVGGCWVGRVRARRRGERRAAGWRRVLSPAAPLPRRNLPLPPPPPPPLARPHPFNLNLIPPHPPPPECFPPPPPGTSGAPSTAASSRSTR